MTGQFDQTIASAVRYHQAGQLAEAERMYRMVLSVSPSNPDALHLLGLIAAQTGHLAEGIELIKSAISSNPLFVEAISNLGRLLFDAGQLEESAATYRRALEIRPGDGTLMLCSGMVLRRMGINQAALELLQRAALALPDAREVYLEIGACFKSLGRGEDAIATYREALTRWPDYAGVLNNLGNLLLGPDRSAEGIAFLRRAVAIEPTNASFHANLGDALFRAGELPEAKAHFEFALQRDPNCIQALGGKAAVLAQKQIFGEAIALQRRALELKPDDAALWSALGDIYLSAHHLEEAETAFRSALKIRETDVRPWMGLGVAYRAMGRFDKAENCFRKALDVEPGHIPAKNALAMIGELAEAAEIDRLQSAVNSAGEDHDQRIMARFALARVFDVAGRYDDAFEHYAAANAEIKERGPDSDAFVSGALAENFEHVVRIFRKEFFSSRSDWGTGSEMPVFIVGMPRSGTTLIEQILASHSKVFGAGELNEIHIAAQRLGYPENAPNWSKQLISDASQEHIEFLLTKARGRAASFVVDKLPGNIKNLGLIATLFPRARIIYSERDPLDNCLSCYFQQFSAAGLSFTCDLRHCAEQYLGQQRLKQHWLNVLPLRSISIQYEELVADLEGQSRRLIDFLGLEWEPKCLEFHKTERPVFTASVWQVRQPLYSSSVGRWKHYRKHLGPLFEALGISPDAE